MIIDIENSQTDLTLDLSKVRKLIAHLLSFLDFKGDEISFRFVSEEEISKIHEDHFNDPSPTDCITFPIDTDEDEGYRHIGECIISPRAAIEFAQKTQSDPYRELTLYIVHTLLHLKGYDDIEEADEHEMRNQEERVLAHLDSEGLTLNT
ncbi:MAG: rRNA maturation RNase YbeY [Simkaniaceae bacterium]|nr:rRNA maturation RNase YbeY [Simkaniaceae bacterium]MCF7851713.1 rRNA maturation RNase YbeY [Simkaniaceae bacterium]